MLTEIKLAKDMYDNVIYITPKLKNDNRHEVNYPNVSIVEVSKNTRKSAYIVTPFLFFRKEAISTMVSFLKQKKRITKDFLQYVTSYLFCGFQMRKTLKNVLNKYSNTDVTCLSTWFHVEAYALALVRESNKQIKAYSYAHSFEIDPDKNPYVPFSMNNTKHTYLDGVYFISDVMRTIYIDQVPYLTQDMINKMHVSYLGSIRKSSKMNPINNGVFHICSCSGVTEVKRLHLIIEALSLCGDIKVKWSHIGWEHKSVKDNLLRLIEERLTGKNNIIVEFLGRFSNEQVISYYEENSVDLFINVSEAEGIPVSIMEACSFGIPIMATDVGGTRELVSDENGCLLPKNIDGQSLSQALIAFYNLPDDNRAQKRISSFNKWATKFDAKKNMTVFLQTIKN